jgi:hypothetical protein
MSSSGCVQSLDLSENRVHILQNDSFLTYTRLSTVILSYNRMEHVQQNVFTGLRMLMSIDLSHNKLQTIHPEIFSSNPLLERVSLSSNPLISISTESSVLVSDSLSVLDLSSCSLTAVHPVMFSHLPNLYSLDLSSNSLQTISVGTLEKLSKLKIVKLSNNRWTCSCDLVEVMEWANERMRRLQHPALKPVRCFQGEQYKTLWSAAGGGGSCDTSTDLAPLVPRDVTDLAPDLPSRITASLALTPKTVPPLSLPVEVRHENELMESMEKETGSWGISFSWNTGTMLVIIILPCMLFISVLLPLTVVKYLKNRIKIYDLQNEIQAKDDHIAALLSHEPLLDPHPSACFTGHTSRNSQHSYCGEHHVYEQIR